MSRVFKKLVSLNQDSHMVHPLLLSDMAFKSLLFFYCLFPHNLFLDETTLLVLKYFPQSGLHSCEVLSSLLLELVFVWES